jgi:N-acetyl-anhydromuramyl-L-alanine amidase AmpD
MKTDKPLNLPASSAKQTVCHWTGGSYTPSSLDKHHYHFLIDGDGMVHHGEYPVDANDSTADGEYAAHVRSWNAQTIGLAVCCMAGAKESPFDPGRYPIKRIQWDTLAELAAVLCKHYGIPITEKTVLMHSEVEPNIGIQQAGKWDINVVPTDTKPWVKLLSPQEAGALFRVDVRTAYAKLTSPPATESREVTEADIIALRDELAAHVFDAFEPLLNKLK